MLILWKSKTSISSMATSKAICLLFLLVCCVHTTLGSPTNDTSSDNDIIRLSKQKRMDVLIALFPESYKEKAQEIALKLWDIGITSPEDLGLLDTIQPELDMLQPNEAQTLLNELKNKDPNKDPAPNEELAKIEEEVSEALNGSSKVAEVALFFWKDGVKTLSDFDYVDTAYTAKDFTRMLGRIQAIKMLKKLKRRAVARQESKSSNTTPNPSTSAPTTLKPSKPSTSAPTTLKPSKPSTSAPTTLKPSKPSTSAPTTLKPSKASTPAPTAPGRNNTNTTKRGNDASSKNNSITTPIAAVKDHSHDGEQHFDEDNNKTSGSTRLFVFILFAILVVAVFYTGYTNRTKIQAWVMDKKKTASRPSSKNYKRVAEDVEGDRAQAKTDATYNYIY